MEEELKFDDEGKLIFPHEEPEKLDKRALKLGMKVRLSEHITWEVKKKHYDNFNSVDKKTRQKILSAWRKGGISIKKVADKFKVDSMVVSDIIYLNLKQISILRSESL